MLRKLLCYLFHDKMIEKVMAEAPRCKKDPSKFACVTYKIDSFGRISHDFGRLKQCECAREKWRRQLDAMKEYGGFND